MLNSSVIMKIGYKNFFISHTSKLLYILVADPLKLRLILLLYCYIHYNKTLR